MRMSPLLTVVITNYNHALYLPKAIDSLLSQITTSTYEILIIDDASTDSSWEIIQRYVHSFPVVRAVRHFENRGVVAALNTGAKEAKGLYLHTMGADDFRLPGFFEKTLEPLIKNPKIGVACSDFGYIKGKTNEGPVHTDRLIQERQTTQIFYADEILKIFQTTHFWIPGHTAIYKREFAFNYGLYRTELKFYCDWFLLHQIALYHGAAYIPETLSVWWIHTHSYSNHLLNSSAEKKSVYRTLLSFLDKEATTKTLFKKSTLLRGVFNTLIGELYYRPKCWPFLWYFGRKSLYWKWKAIL